MRRVVRSRTRTPRVFSRSATARLTAAFGTPSARAAAEKPLRSTTLASMASWAGVQIRFMVASIPRLNQEHCFTWEALAPVCGKLRALCHRNSVKGKTHENLDARDVRGGVCTDPRQPVVDSREGHRQCGAAKDRTGGPALCASRARHAAAH